ncbi:MAG: branched-chain amino acid ABC transporter permease, partial [Caldimonas sp.]
MAMSQLLYFFFVGLRTYGGDDGLRIVARPVVGLGIDITSDAAFFLVVLAWLVLVHVLMAVVVRSRFGLALSAIRENEQRALAVGYNVARYRLGAFVLAGTMAGLAGALLAMHNLYVSPQLLHWSQSGTLLIMVALGGVGYFYGGILGAAALLAIEELLSSNFTYFHVYTGLILLAVVLLVPDGLSSVSRWRRLRAAAR